MRKQLLVESIRVDGQTQSRAKISDVTVGEYAEVMKADVGAPFPAVTVFFDGTDYWLADGFHRLLAAQQIGRKNVAANVFDGSREAAAWASCAANQFHGLRRTVSDKRKAVEIALKLHPEKSDRVLAEHCGVGRMLVGEVRRKLVAVTKWPPPEARVGKDGKSRSVPGAKTQAVEAQGAECHQLSERTVDAQGSGSRQLSERTVDEPSRSIAGPVDGVGRLIPEDRLELWNRGSEVQSLLSAISMVRVALRKAQANRDPLYSEVPYSSTLIALDKAYNGVQVTKPYAVCAHCQGHGCKACGQRGLIGKWRWDLLPVELKKEVERLVKKGAANGE